MTEISDAELKIEPVTAVQYVQDKTAVFITPVETYHSVRVSKKPLRPIVAALAPSIQHAVSDSMWVGR